MTEIGGVPSSGPGASFSLSGYEGLAEVGRGGCAVVFKAWQRDLNRWVAIKVLDMGPGRAPRSQFGRERAAIGALSGHPSIVTVYEAGLLRDGRGFIVMEYLPDGTLADRLQDGPLAWEDAVRVGVRLSGALESAHRIGVLHLDVKPENVFASPDFDAVKLGDFGIARLPGQTVTRSGLITGTVLHLAPERLLDTPPTAAADVYSLGSTLFTLIVGHPPFGRAGEADHVVMARIMNGRPAVHELGAHAVPAPVVETIKKALERDPADRQTGAGELGEQLRAAQAAVGRTVTAMTVTTPSAGPPAPAPDQPARRTVVTRPLPRATELLAGSRADTLPPRSTPAGPAHPDDRLPSEPRRRRPGVLIAATGAVMAFALVLLLTSPWSNAPPPARPGVTEIAPPSPQDALLAFGEDFSDPSSGWPRATDYNYDGNGQYGMRLRTDHNRLAAGPRQGEGAIQALSAAGVNVAVDVDAEVVSNTQGGMGLYCRLQPDKDRYRSVVYTDGEWNISRDSKGTKPLVTGVATLPSEGGRYHIRLECSGPPSAAVVTLSVGGKVLGQWTEANGLDGGQVGVQVVTGNAAFVEVRFDDFRITRL